MWEIGLLVVLSLSLQTSTVYCVLTKTCLARDMFSGGVAMCGSLLSDTLSSLCSVAGGYHTGKKRSVPDRSRGLARYTLDKSTAMSMLRRKRGSGGNTVQHINCECCHNTCSPKELCDYCNKPEVCVKFYMGQLSG